jgi:hypothetical protein
MKKQHSFTISIPTPCSEDWDKMTTTEQGKHCASCNKTVMDLSLYSDKELVELLKKVNTPICGHVSAYQLNREIVAYAPQSRTTFFKKLFLGTALASWLGLVDKADAQNATPHPVKVESSVSTGDGTNKTVTDTSKYYINFTFVDSLSGKPVNYVDVTLTGQNVQRYYTSENNKLKVYIPAALVGQQIQLTFYNDTYASTSIEMKAPQAPMKKKVKLYFVGPKIMYNGGLSIRENNTTVK